MPDINIVTFSAGFGIASVLWIVAIRWRLVGCRGQLWHSWDKWSAPENRKDNGLFQSRQCRCCDKRMAREYNITL